MLCVSGGTVSRGNVVCFRGNSKYHYYGIRIKANSPLNQFTDDQTMAMRQQPLYNAKKWVLLSSRSNFSTADHVWNNWPLPLVSLNSQLFKGCHVCILPRQMLCHGGCSDTDINEIFETPRCNKVSLAYDVDTSSGDWSFFKVIGAKGNVLPLWVSQASVS